MDDYIVGIYYSCVPEAFMLVRSNEAHGGWRSMTFKIVICPFKVVGSSLITMASSVVSDQDI